MAAQNAVFMFLQIHVKKNEKINIQQLNLHHTDEVCFNFSVISKKSEI